MRIRLVFPLGIFALLVLVAYAPAAPNEVARPLVPADSEWTWPEHPENLQVLPQDIGAEGLRNVMRSFTRALDVRCDHCHVGEGRDFNDWDFVSDEKGHKEVAREMMRMTRAINVDLLASIEGLHGDASPDPGAWRVTCWTCHRGSTTPATQQDPSEAERPAGPPEPMPEHHEHEHEDDHGDEHHDEAHHDDE